MARNNYGEICFDITSLGGISSTPVALPNDVFESIKKLTNFDENIGFQKIDKNIYVLCFDAYQLSKHKVRIDGIGDDLLFIFGSYGLYNVSYYLSISNDGNIILEEPQP